MISICSSRELPSETVSKERTKNEKQSSQLEVLDDLAHKALAPEDRAVQVVAVKEETVRREENKSARRREEEEEDDGREECPLLPP